MRHSRLVICIALLALLSACGLKKNLYLPKDPQTAQTQKPNDVTAPAPAPAAPAPAAPAAETAPDSPPTVVH